MAASEDGAFALLQYRYDALNVNEAMNYLFKKSIGYPNTLPQGSIFNELVGDYNSFPFINKNKLYNQTVPNSNLPFNNYILDPIFSNINFRFPNGNPPIRNDLESRRYYCSNYPYIAYYSNLLLTPIANANAIPYNTLQTVAFGHPLLVNSIPATYAPYNNNTPGAYSVNLLTSNIANQQIISKNDGYWLIDTDTGLLTLYDSNTNIKLGIQLDNDNQPIIVAGQLVYNLPRISFYRYEGLIDSTNVANTQDF